MSSSRYAEPPPALEASPPSPSQALTNGADTAAPADAAVMPSANERWLQFSRWLLFHRVDLRATQYIYGTPDDIPSAAKESSQQVIAELAMWDGASTPADMLPAFLDDHKRDQAHHVTGHVYHADHSIDQVDSESQFTQDADDPNGDASQTPHRDSLYADTAGHSGDVYERVDAAEEQASAHPRGILGRVKRRLQRVRLRLREVKERL